MATIRKRGGKWQAKVRCNGQTASRTFSQRSDAVRWSRETERKAERGEMQSAAVFANSAMTLAQVLARYRDEVTCLKRCGDNERYAINGFMRSKLASVRLGKLTPARIAKYRDQRLERMKPATIVRELGWLQHAIDIACSDWGQHLPDGNPVRQVRRPKIDNRRECRLQAHEWERLLEAVNDERSPLMKSLLELSLTRGVRREELLAWSRVMSISRAVPYSCRKRKMGAHAPCRSVQTQFIH